MVLFTWLLGKVFKNKKKEWINPQEGVHARDDQDGDYRSTTSNNTINSAATPVQKICVCGTCDLMKYVLETKNDDPTTTFRALRGVGWVFSKSVFFFHFFDAPAIHHTATSTVSNTTFCESAKFKYAQKASCIHSRGLVKLRRTPPIILHHFGNGHTTQASATRTALVK